MLDESSHAERRGKGKVENKENSEGENDQKSEEENSQISDEKNSDDNENPDENPNNVDEIPNSTPTKEDDKEVEIFYKKFTTLSMLRVSGKLWFRIIRQWP